MCRTPATRRSNRTILADIPHSAKSDREAAAAAPEHARGAGAGEA